MPTITRNGQQPPDVEQINAAADLLVRPRTSMHKAASLRMDPFTEIGTTGLRQYGGFVLEEWLQQLSGRRAAWVWREMLDNDPTVGATMFAIRWLARGAEWRVEEGNQPEAAELVETCMHDMSHTWGDFVSEALSMLPYGWAFHEQVYKRRQGPQGPAPSSTTDTVAALADTEEDDSNTASSQYSDGKIGWRKLPIRAQETLLRWGFQGYSGISFMEQVDWHGGNHRIPIEKALLFRTQTTRNNPEGRPILRNAFTSYHALKNIKTIEQIGIERDLAGIPVATPPDGVDLFAAGNKALLQKVQEMVTGVRRDEYEGIVLPTAGWTFELVKSGGSRQVDTDAIVRRYRQDIAVSMLADFVLIGMDSVGSFAMVDVKSDLFGLAIDGILDLICEVMNRYAIPRLLQLNGMDVSEPPEIHHGSAGRIDLDKVGSFLFNLAGSGAPIPWSAELLSSLFTEAGLPANFEESSSETPLVPVKAPQLPSGTEPFAREPHDEPPPAEPADAAAGAGGKPRPLSKADASTAAMVALYPHKDVAHKLALPGGEPASDLHLTLAFLGDAAKIKDPQALRDTVARFAASTPPLTGHVSGTGQFTAGPEPVTYASADMPALAAHRQRLVGHLEAAGQPPSQDHGFTPHITLAYKPLSPTLAHHPLRFDHVSLKLGEERHDFPLQGKQTPAPVAKAASERTRSGTVIHVGEQLRQRHAVLSAQLEQEINAALAELGEQAATAYATHATKAAGGGMLHRLLARVIRSLNLNAWVQTRLLPILRNHSARVVADTQRVLQTEIGLELHVADEDAVRIAAQAGQDLNVSDIEPQVRQAIMLAIRSGLQAGDNPLRTAARIRALVPAGRFVNAGAKYRSRLIAREQTARAQRAASLASYKSNPNITAVRLRDGIFGAPRSDEPCISRSGAEVPIGRAASVHAEHPLCTLALEPVVTGVRVPEPIPALAA